MSKIVMVNVGAHGHVNPTIPVIGELVKRGSQVHYFAPEAFRAAITKEGGKFESYDSIFGKVPPPAGAPMQELMAQMPGRLTGECLHALPQIEDRIAALKPDLVIYDKFSVAARLIAKDQSIKAATFLPSYAANQHFNLGKLFSGKMSPPSPDHPALVQFRADAERIKQRFGVAFTGLHDIFGYSEPLNVCFVAKSFQYEGDKFDDHFAFVGPCVSQRDHSHKWDTDDKDSRPVLFISLGTVFNSWPEFFRMCFEAFGGSEWRVLMAVGKNVERSALGAPPENFQIAEHLPQLDILEKTSVFVTHGGMNSTMEALWFGVPMVVVPQMAEQAATARRVNELGLGVAFERDSLTIADLRQAVTRLKDDTAVRTKLRAMQQDVRASGGQAKAAEVILKYIAKN